MKKYIGRIVTFSSDKQIFGVKTINTINGIDFDSVSIKDSNVLIEDEIILIAVSSMYRVHGYDRLISGIGEYYKNGGNRKIVLKLIGKGDELESYSKLIEDYKIYDNVVVKGAVFGEELAKEYQNVAMGINSLAIHRQDLVNESTLKTKEYAAYGLPIMSSSYVDALSKTGNEQYVFSIPADESFVDIEKMIIFLDNLYLNAGLSPMEIKREIRDIGKQCCDMKNTIKPIVEYFIS
jgi:glycosyltransferase involved in cell wall biosynthesis